MFLFSDPSHLPFWPVWLGGLRIGSVFPRQKRGSWFEGGRTCSAEEDLSRSVLPGSWTRVRHLQNGTAACGRRRSVWWLRSRSPVRAVDGEGWVPYGIRSWSLIGFCGGLRRDAAVRRSLAAAQRRGNPGRRSVAGFVPQMFGHGNPLPMLLRSLLGLLFNLLYLLFFVAFVWSVCQLLNNTILDGDMAGVCSCSLWTGLTMAASRSAFFSTSRQAFARWRIIVHFKEVALIASAITPSMVTLVTSFLSGALEPCLCSHWWRRWLDLVLRWWLLFMVQYELGGGFSLRQWIRWLPIRIRVCNFFLGLWLLAGFVVFCVIFCLLGLRASFSGPACPILWACVPHYLGLCASLSGPMCLSISGLLYPLYFA